MRQIIEVVLPFFAVVGVGYAAARRGLIGLHGNQGLTTFVYWFAIPMLLFRGVATRGADEFRDFGLLAAYALSTLVLFFAVGFAARRAFGLGRMDGIFHGFGAAQSNNGFLAVPLMPALFGEQAIAPVVLTMFADVLVLYPLAFVLADLASGAPVTSGALARRIARTFYTNPFLIAIGAGIAVATTGVAIPDPVLAFATLAGQAGPPTALFALGASLALHAAGGGALGPIATMNVGKLVLHPLVFAAIALWVVPLPPLHLTVGIAAAALPTGINLFLISQRYVANVGVYSAAILASTALSVVTFSAVVLWLTR